MDEILLLVLLLTANGSPIIAQMILGSRGEAALDRGRRFADGRPVFGPSKTLRGVLAALLATTLAGLALGYSWYLGALLGTFAMLGDLVSSFTKRRLGMPSGSMALGLDHIPESLLPLLVCRPLLGLSWDQVLALTAGFMVANLLLSRLMFHFGLRQHPH
jgi:CDP-2,3-bis-(O-geranylgeranyl)-sn-glycerol synthase